MFRRVIFPAGYSNINNGGLYEKNCDDNVYGFLLCDVRERAKAVVFDFGTRQSKSFVQNVQTRQIM